MKSKKSEINILWISYDLGFSGDYDSMYEFLDKYKAVECGDSFARINNIEYSGDIREYLISKLPKNIKDDKSSRIYYVFYNKDSNQIRSGFIYGKRKVAPWKGYAEDLSSMFEEDDS